MSDTTTYPEAARHCSCLAHRAGHPEKHIAEPGTTVELSIADLIDANPMLRHMHDITVGNPFRGGVA